MSTVVFAVLCLSIMCLNRNLLESRQLFLGEIWVLKYNKEYSWILLRLLVPSASYKTTLNLLVLKRIKHIFNLSRIMLWWWKFFLLWHYKSVMWKGISPTRNGLKGNKKSSTKLSVIVEIFDQKVFCLSLINFLIKLFCYENSSPIQFRSICFQSAK